MEHDDPAGEGSGGEHLLLTVLGMDSKPARYTLAGVEERTSFAPCALLELLPPPDRPDRVVVLVTPQAEATTLPKLEEALSGRYELEAVRVPDFSGGQDERAYLDDFLRIAVGAVPHGPDVQLTIDITHGLRHFSFLTYVAALYLSALRDVRIRGAYYAIFNHEPVESPFLDVRPLLELPGWVHAATVLGETGSAKPISEILAESAGGPQADQAIATLRRLSEAYLSGLPLELGRAVNEAAKQRRSLTKLLRDQHRVPLARELVGRIGETVVRYALPEPVAGRDWKTSVALSPQELSRQAALIDDLWRRGAIAEGLGLLREWTVSWAQWRLDAPDNWIRRELRQSAEATLSALAAMVDRPSLCEMMFDAQRDLGSFWRDLASLRNSYHHHAMRPEVVRSDSKTIDAKLSTVWPYWEKTLRACPAIPLRLPGNFGGWLLVSPVGTRPGALFSAVTACWRKGYGEPAHCLLICSAETEPRATEALERAGYTGSWESVRLEDPYGGSNEIDPLAKQAVATLVGADGVLVNLTGGTTVMGLVAVQMADEAGTRETGTPVRADRSASARPAGCGPVPAQRRLLAREGHRGG